MVDLKRRADANIEATREASPWPREVAEVDKREYGHNLAH